MAKHPERPNKTSVQQSLLHETPIESNYHGDNSGANFDLMIKIGSKSSSILIGGDRQEEEARSICPNEKSLIVMHKELSPPRRPVLSLSNINIFHCNAQHTGGKPQDIPISIDERGACICNCSECIRNTKLRASHIKIDEFRPTIHPVDSNLLMPPPSPLEL
jgi:hypothetical protein